MGSSLKIFDGTSFVPIDSTHRPDANLMTIVITHGMTQDPNCNDLPGITDWPTTMANAMRANGITSGIANIVGWDWLEAARFTDFFRCGTPPAERTTEQGVALGNR